MKYYYTDLCFFEDIYELPDPYLTNGDYWMIAVLAELDAVTVFSQDQPLDAAYSKITFRRDWLNEFGNVKLVWKKIS